MKSMKMGGSVCLIAGAAIWAPLYSALAAERHVPSEYGTIQAAINACVGGDVVVVANGTYTGGGNKDLDFGGRAITVRSAGGDPVKCIIDCGGSGRGFYFHSGETSSAIVQGLTIRNGYVSSLGGGGIYCGGASPAISNCMITANRAYSSGGGLYISGSSSVIANNTITCNSAPYGAGLEVTNGSTPMIANNTIMGNRASVAGGGLDLETAFPSIANTIVAFNSSGISQYAGGFPTLWNNCVYGNSAYNYSGLTDPTGTNGNISADPAIAGRMYGGWHLQPDSPCVGAGNNASVYGSLDLDGQARIQPLGGTVDIGADESDGTIPRPGPFVIVRVSPLGDDGQDGSSWSLPKRTVQAGIQAASAVGGDVWVQAGTYYERITLLPFAHVYGGFSGSETAREERDWKVHVTSLDGQQQGTVVTSSQPGYAVSTLDGFTITHGSAVNGGGLYLTNTASPTIANNTITGNSASAGGGLCLFSSSATIVNNTITANSASYGAGAGLYLSASPATIAGNSITGNSASYGGGLCLASSAPTIANNTIAANSAYDGGGLYLGSSSSPTLANTIVAFNSSGIYRNGSSGTPTLQYNCAYGNAAYNYSGMTDPTGTNGNISADPLFRRPNGPDNDPNTWADNDYRLMAGSPCIDAGSNAAVPADTPDLDGDRNVTEPLPFDLDGRPRFVDDSGTPDCPWAPGTCGAPPIVDMGAYEFQGTTRLAGDLNCDGVIDYRDINPFVRALAGQAAYEASYPACRWLNADTNNDGIVSYADIDPFVHLLGG